MNSVRTRNSIYADCMRFELYSGPCTCNQQISRLAGLTPTSLGRSFGYVLGFATQCNFYSLYSSFYQEEAGNSIRTIERTTWTWSTLDTLIGSTLDPNKDDLVVPCPFFSGTGSAGLGTRDD